MHVHACTSRQETQKRIERAFKIGLALPSTPLCHLTLCGGRNENRSGGIYSSMIHLILYAPLPSTFLNSVVIIEPATHVSKQLLFSQLDEQCILLKMTPTRTRAWPTKMMERHETAHSDGIPPRIGREWDVSVPRNIFVCGVEGVCTKITSRISPPYYARFVTFSRQVPGFLPAFSVRLKIIFRRRQNSIQAA